MCGDGHSCEPALSEAEGSSERSSLSLPPAPQHQQKVARPRPLHRSASLRPDSQERTGPTRIPVSVPHRQTQTRGQSRRRTTLIR